MMLRMSCHWPPTDVLAGSMAEQSGLSGSRALSALGCLKAEGAPRAKISGPTPVNLFLEVELQAGGTEAYFRPPPRALCRYAVRSAKTIGTYIHARNLIGEAAHPPTEPPSAALALFKIESIPFPSLIPLSLSNHGCPQDSRCPHILFCIFFCGICQRLA